MNIAENINMILKQENLQQKELAVYLGIAPSTLNGWLKLGRSIPSEYLIRISEFLGVSVEYLLNGVDNDKRYNNNDLSNSKDVAFGENTQINKNNEMDNLSHEMINEFEKLSFIDKAKVINLIAELREKYINNS